MIDSTTLAYVRQHPRPRTGCVHRKYLLTCQEYDALMTYAGRRCQMCGFEGGDRQRLWLVIDHDHRRAQWAVRGILCSHCNTQLGRFENGLTVKIDEAAARTYLAQAWVDTYFGIDRTARKPEPPVGSIVFAPRGTHAGRYGRFPEGWQRLQGWKYNHTSIVTWSVMNRRYGPHLLEMTGEVLPPHDKARIFHRKLHYAYN